jgi:signal transduction histidine kinase
MTSTGVGLGLSALGTLAAAAAAFGSWVAARHSKSSRSRLAWGLLAASALGWTLVSASILVTGASAPNRAEAIALIATAALAASGMAAFPGSPPHASGRARTLVDGLIVGGSALFVAWTLGLDDLYEAHPALGGRLTLAYALAVLVIASGSIVMLTRAPPAARARLALAAGGFSALAVATGAIAYAALGGATGLEPLYAGWPVGWLLIGLAARGFRDQTQSLEPGLPTRASVFIPSIPFAIAVLAAASAGARDDFGEFLIWNGAIVIVLIVARQILALVENISFWNDLLARMEERTQEARRSEARRDAARDAERAKDEFFALVSHELRTPLASIIGYAELLEEVDLDRLSDEGRGYLEVVHRNAERQLRLVEDLLLLLRIQRGSFVVELGAADLEEIVKHAVDDARVAADRREISLSVETDHTPPIRGDAHRLGQMVDNLLSNAIKFTPQGGRVTARLRSRNGAATIEVKDSGVGITTTEQERIFERAFRASTAKDAKTPGLGLGLTIVDAIVERHGGRIQVESERGVGTTFRVELPLDAPAER